MTNECRLSPLSLLRMQTWFSPAFPIGSYSYSHGIEWAVDAGKIHDRGTLTDWLQADLCYGSGRNDAIFFSEAWRCAEDHAQLFEIAKLAAAYRGTSELALESSQQGTSALKVLRHVWPDRILDGLFHALLEHNVDPTLAVVLGISCASQGVPLRVALPLFLQSYVANLVSTGVRLVPLGQTDGQLAIAQLETAVLAASTELESMTIEHLGSAAFMVDLSSMKHESQYTRLFRS